MCLGLSEKLTNNMLNFHFLKNAQHNPEIMAFFKNFKSFLYILCNKVILRPFKNTFLSSVFYLSSHLLKLAIY